MKSKYGLVFLLILVACGQQAAQKPVAVPEAPVPIPDQAKLLLGNWRGQAVAGAGGFYEIREYQFKEDGTIGVSIDTQKQPEVPVGAEGRILTYRYLGTYVVGALWKNEEGTRALTAKLSDVFLTLRDRSFVKEANRGAGLLTFSNWVLGEEKKLTAKLPSDYFADQDLAVSLRDTGFRIEGDRLFWGESIQSKKDGFTRIP